MAFIDGIGVACIRGLKGVTVALSEDGRLSCSYLGTDPSMVSHPSANLRELDYASVEAEMKQLQQIIKEQQSKSCKKLALVFWTQLYQCVLPLCYHCTSCFCLYTSLIYFPICFFLDLLYNLVFYSLRCNVLAVLTLITLFCFV